MKIGDKLSLVQITTFNFCQRRSQPQRVRTNCVFFHLVSFVWLSLRLKAKRLSKVNHDSFFWYQDNQARSETHRNDTRSLVVPSLFLVSPDELDRKTLTYYFLYFRNSINGLMSNICLTYLPASKTQTSVLTHVLLRESSLRDYIHSSWPTDVVRKDKHWCLMRESYVISEFSLF